MSSASDPLITTDEERAQQKIWSPLRNDTANESRLLKTVKWLCPFFLAGFGWFIQSIGLHYATYSYVQHMMGLEKAQRTIPQYAVLPDPLADALGPQEVVHLAILDLIAGLFPFAFVILSCCKRKYTLQVWTKTMICAFFLFSLKGMIGAMTTVPDSSGWEVCKARLKPEGIKWFSEHETFRTIMFVDFEWLSLYHHPLRYCSDMMFSGHTFVVTLFALGCYEVLRIIVNLADADSMEQTDEDASLWNDPRRRTILMHVLSLSLLSLVAIGEQATEIYFVLRSRFHYSSDVFVALIMVFLLYTNVQIAVVAKQWEVLGPLALIPVAKFPKGLQTFFYKYFPESLLPDPVFLEPDKRELCAFISRGDAYVPWCCFPFCFSSGRAHIYNDAGVSTLYSLYMRYKEKGNAQGPDNPELVKEMNLNEGIDMSELCVMLGQPADMFQSASNDLLPPCAQTRPLLSW